MLLNRFLPNKQVKSIFEIKPEELKSQGIKGIITDLDNTLVAWNVEDATPEVEEWFRLMKDHNIKVTIISNNNQERVKIFSDPLGTAFVAGAKKPLRRAFIDAAKAMGLRKDEVVVVGDQLLTDVLGGNSAGFKTILVVPIVQSDAPITKFNRRIERMIMNRLRKKGKISWEE